MKRPTPPRERAAPTPSRKAPSAGGPLRWAVALSLLLLGLRLRLAELVGFGDAEALYASYALHPQPAYLDHPGLVGSLARFIGDGGAPTPLSAHRFTAILSTAVPVIGLAAARAGGAPGASAYLTFFALALLPEMSIGLFGLTPDLPLAALWLASLGCALAALRSDPRSRQALVGTLLAGFFAGLCIVAKVSGALLALALLVAVAGHGARPRLRTLAPYCGVLVGAIVVAPFVVYEHAHGYPMLSHRLVATQARAGLSLRNAAALVSGQLLYVTPPFLWQAYRALRELWERRHEPVAQLLLLCCALPAVPLVALCLWSKVAEPHWLGPAYLSLAVALPLVAPPTRRVASACVATGLVAPVIAFVVVATPVLPKLLGEKYRPRYDLVNDLYAWQSGLPLVRAAGSELQSQGYAPVVVGPHWTVCAQLHAGLGASVPVGCRTKDGDDFSGWYPPGTWAAAPVLLYVTDDRFPASPATEFPHYDVASIQSTRIYRGGRLVRTIRVARLERQASAFERSSTGSTARRFACAGRLGGERDHSAAVAGFEPSPSEGP